MTGVLCIFTASKKLEQVFVQFVEECFETFPEFGLLV